MRSNPTAGENLKLSAHGLPAYHHFFSDRHIADAWVAAMMAGMTRTDATTMDKTNMVAELLRKSIS